MKEMFHIFLFTLFACYNDYALTETNILSFAGSGILL